jgi:hypothetical protein
MKNVIELDREAAAVSQALIKAIRQAAARNELPSSWRTPSYIWRVCAVASHMGLDATAVIEGDGEAVLGAILDLIRKGRDVPAIPDDPVWFRVGRIATATVALY